MKITQSFRSASDGRLIGEIEFAASQATPIPVAGDDVSWVADGKAYQGRVKSRLISYSAPDKVDLERLDAVEISAVLRVELLNN